MPTPLFTPGPWTYGIHESAGKPDGVWIYDKEYDYHIAHLWAKSPFGRPLTEQKANAVIITQAPAMYAALDEADTAFSVINLCDGLTPQARKALAGAWIGIQTVMGDILGPDSAFAIAAKANNARRARRPDPWSNDPAFPPEDWQAEVTAGDTRRGYRDWVNAKKEEEEHDNAL